MKKIKNLTVKECIKICKNQKWCDDKCPIYELCGTPFQYYAAKDSHNKELDEKVEIGEEDD